MDGYLLRRSTFVDPQRVYCWKNLACPDCPLLLNIKWYCAVVQLPEVRAQERQVVASLEVSQLCKPSLISPLTSKTLRDERHQWTGKQTQHEHQEDSTEINFTRFRKSWVFWKGYIVIGAAKCQEVSVLSINRLTQHALIINS